MPGVQYNTRDKTLRGPLYRRENKMAIHDYKVISNSRENAKIRYDIHEGSPVVKPKEEKTPTSEVKHDSIANMGSVIKKKRHGHERMKGDATKSGILQEDHHLHNISSKHFGSGSLSQSRRINEGAFTGRKNNDYFTREQGMRPTTAKKHYNNILKRMSGRRSVKETGNRFSIKQKVFEDVTNFSMKSNTMQRRNNSKNLRMSAFNKFNHDLVQGKVSNVTSGSQARVNSAAYNTRPMRQKDLIQEGMSSLSSQRGKLKSASRLNRISRAIKTSMRENRGKIMVKEKL